MTPATRQNALKGDSRANGHKVCEAQSGGATSWVSLWAHTSHDASGWLRN